MKRHPAGICCCVATLITAMAMARSVQAQVAVAPAGGGTEGNPYQITELGNLVWMRDTVDSSFMQYYTLQNDIDASEAAGWYAGAGFAPIGSNEAPFFGTFHGSGKTISHLTINRPSETNVGLFGIVGYTAGGVGYLRLTSCSIVGRERVGSVAGDNGGTLIDCEVSGSVTGRSYVGGIVGVNGGTMGRCRSGARVSGSNYVGGVVGYFPSPASVLLSECGATGAVSGTSYVGGLLGGAMTPYDVVMRRCYALGTVQGNVHDVGGLAGNFEGLMGNCYAAGSVTGQTGVGALIGSMGVAESSISNCYAVGRVSGGGSFVGGLLGLNAGTAFGSYWDTQACGQASSAGGTGKTTVQMKQKATYSDWDFTNIWRIADNEIYPYLACQTLAAPPPELENPEIGTGGIAVLRWSSATNHLYTIHYSTNLVAGFLPLHEDLLGRPPVNAYTDSVSGVDFRFWKVSTVE